jgi:hypothetical protein
VLSRAQARRRNDNGGNCGSHTQVGRTNGAVSGLSQSGRAPHRQNVICRLLTVEAQGDAGLDSRKLRGRDLEVVNHQLVAD